MSQDAKKPRGRPPSKVARRKALTAAAEILKSDGFGRLTIEAVSAKSGVGKPTIYRHWANASELAMAALMERHPEDVSDSSGSLQDRLEQQVTSIVLAFGTTRGRQITLALAAADQDSEMTKAFRNRIILSGREAGRRMIENAVEMREIPAPEHIEVCLDMIYAPIFYRVLLGHMPLDASFAMSLVSKAVMLLKTQE